MSIRPWKPGIPGTRQTAKSYQATFAGFTINANYTFSKSSDNCRLERTLQASVQPDTIRYPSTCRTFKVRPGPSDFDHRHVFVHRSYGSTGVKKVESHLRGVAGNWQLTGVISAQTGSATDCYAGKISRKLESVPIAARSSACRHSNPVLAPTLLPA